MEPKRPMTQEEKKRLEAERTARIERERREQFEYEAALAKQLMKDNPEARPRQRYVIFADKHERVRGRYRRR